MHLVQGTAFDDDDDDVEHENCGGDTNCCSIIEKCDKAVGLVAGKIGHNNEYFITQKNNATRNSKDLKKSIKVPEKGGEN